MRLDVRNMTPQQIADANNQWLAQNSQPFTGQPKRPMQSDMGAIGGMPLMPMLPMGVPPMGVPPMGFDMGAIGLPPIGEPMDRQRQPGQQYSPEMQAYYTQDAADQAEKVRRLGLTRDTSGGTGMPPMGVPMGVPSVGFGAAPIGLPPIGEPMGGRRPYGLGAFGPYNTDPSRPQPVGFAGGGTGMPPIGQPMAQPPISGGLPYNNGFNNPCQPQQPMAQPPAGGGTGTSPQPYNNGFYNPGQPMAMKKGGFAVKAVWDKKRPKDLGEPKDLSVKRKKSAKARAKAAGRPYPNLIDNMAAARKKGK